MKKTISLALVMLSVFSMLSFLTQQTTADALIFEDDFESYDVGTFPHPPWDLWYSGQSASVVDTISHSGSKSLRLLGANGWGCWVGRSITVSEKMGYEAMIRAENWGIPGKVGAVVCFGKNVGYGAWGWAGVALTADGRIIAGGMELQIYELNIWYKVKAVFDLTSSTYSIWIDDVLKAESIPETGHPNPETEIQALLIGSDHAEQIAYFDDVKFFEEPLQEVVPATIDIDPDTLNLKSKGKWITAYIELPEGYDVNDINVTTIMLNDTIPAETHPVGIGDEDGDGIPDLMVKFSRAEVTSYILANINMTKLFEERSMTITLTITGKLNDETPFQGSDTVRIIMPMPRGRQIFPF